MKIYDKNGNIQEQNFDSDPGAQALRHTAAHILAQAVKRLWPETKCAIGPAIADGFYYDFEFDFEFSSEHFEEIEAEMKKIAKENLQLRHFVLSREEALKLMTEKTSRTKSNSSTTCRKMRYCSFISKGTTWSFAPVLMSAIPVR